MENEYLEHLLLNSNHLATLSNCYIANSDRSNDNNIYAIMKFIHALPGIHEVSDLEAVEG